MAVPRTSTVGVLAIGSLAALSMAACGGSDPDDSSGAPTLDATAATVEVPADRSLDVTYDDGTIAVSFEPLGHPRREMHAQMLRMENGGWMYFGILRTDNADEPGEFVADTKDGVAVLSGVNLQPAPDLYVAPDLPSGTFLICTELVPRHDTEVCGALIIG